MFLLGNECYDKCPTTHHGISDTKTCEACTLPCKTCEGSLTHCTSCDDSFDSLSLLFRNKCYDDCPAEISVFSEGLCLECNSNCQTCDDQYSPDFCTSCSDGQYLDFYSNSCVQKCPQGVSVPTILAPDDVITIVVDDVDYAQDYSQDKVCETCNPTCLTCDYGNSNICMECRTGLKMLEVSKQCLEECPAGTADVWIPLVQDSVCAECAPGCLTCENSREHCMICEADFVFHEFSCVRSCPEGYVLISD